MGLFDISTEPPRMRPLNDFERAFLLRAWDAVADKVSDHDIGVPQAHGIIRSILWCFPEVRALPRETDFESPKGRIETLPKGWKPKLSVRGVIRRLQDDDMLGHDRCYDLGYRHCTEPLIFESDYVTCN